MNYFLDKVGLQHFVEKVKNLLSGYLPLSGGDISGALQQTMHEGGAEISTTLDRGFDYYYSTLTPDNNYIGTACAIRIDIDGIVFNKNVSTTNDDNINTQAYFDTEKCNTKKFVLSGDPNQGLIANNSETVVKELSDEQVDKLLAGDTSTISDSKYYVSGANLGRFAQNVAKDKSYTIIYAEGGNVEVTTSAGEVTIEPGINYRIDGNYEITSGKENVSTIVQSGPIQDGNTPFINMEGLKGINVSRLDTSNVTSMAAYFARCASLPNFGLFYRDLAYWDTRKVTTFESMFLGCESVTSIQGINVWDTRNVNNMDSVFAACNKLTSLDLSGWSTQSVYSMDAMFDHCSAITTLTLSEGFGRMQNEVGTLNLSALTKWTNASVQTLEDLYDRKANGLGVITIKLSSATKNALGTAGINTLTTKGYTVA